MTLNVHCMWTDSLILTIGTPRMSRTLNNHHEVSVDPRCSDCWFSTRLIYGHSIFSIPITGEIEWSAEMPFDLLQV